MFHGRPRRPWRAVRFGLCFEVDEVLFEGLAVALEALPPLKGCLVGARLEGLAAAA